MAAIEQGVITWLSGCSSSLQISIVSILFIIIYVTLYSLCTSCLSNSHMCLCRGEKTNVVFPQKEVSGVTEQFSRNLNSLEQGELHEHFKQEPISTPSQIPAVSMGTSSPQRVRTLPLPAPPSDLTENLEPLLRSPSFQAQECRNVTSCSDEYTAGDQTDRKYSLLETELYEENPYEYVSEFLSPFLSDRAEGDSETSSPTVTDLEEFHANNSDLNNPVNQQQPHDGRLIGSDPTAVYAAVNWKTKCQKNTQTAPDTCVVEDTDDVSGETAPPVPEKHF